MTDVTFRPQATTLDRAYPHLGKTSLLVGGLFGVLLLLFLLSLATGSVRIPLDNVVAILLGREADKAVWSTIVLDFRLPKALTAALAGAALGVSGLQMQTLFRNPLADPFVLGISSGASLGVALIVLGTGFAGSGFLVAGFGWLGNLGLAAAAGLGAAVVMLLILLVARHVQSVMSLLIVGLMLGYTTGAIVSLLLYFSIAEQIHAYIAWTFGSFGGVTWGQVIIFAPTLLVGLAIAFGLIKSLNALLLGEAYATSMGLNVRLARFWLILSAALLTGTVTAFCGPIAFLGVAVPHLARSLFGTSDHRVLMPATVMVGGILALTADWIAQVPASQLTLPLNAVTALMGAPIVAWIVLGRRDLRTVFAA